MQSTWLVHEGRSSCILFLSGWGMDPTPFRSIPVNDHDLLMVYDYTHVEPAEAIKLLETYQTLHLVAWSMGVWIAGKHFINFQDRFSSVTAINGTLKPIDDRYGIPQKVFNEMVQGYSSTALEQFYRDMFDRSEQADRFLRSRPERSHPSMAEELQTLQQQYRNLGHGENIFTCRIVGSRDRIFPARSQVRSWGKENCTCIKAAHFPFYDWPLWDAVISGETKNSCA